MLRNTYIHALAACGVVTAIAVGICACGDTSQDVVAHAGGIAVTKAALQHWVSVQPGTNTPTTSDPPRQQPPALDLPPFAACATPHGAPDSTVGGGQSASVDLPGPCRKRPSALRQRVLGFLISSAWVLGQAAELGVKVTDRQVEREYKRVSYSAIYGSSPGPAEAELQLLLSGRGETHSDKFWLVKVHMLAAKVQHIQTTQALSKISPTAVAKYYAAYKQRFTLPERRDIQAIMTHTEARVKRAKREIEAGKSFMSVADRLNQQPSEGGVHIGLARRGDKRYERDFFAAPAHVLVGPVKEILYYIFEVTRIVPPKQQTLTQVKDAVRRQLLAGRERHLLTDLVTSIERKWLAKTICRPGYVARQCMHSVGT
jgi:foldase protein PrsA